MINFPRTDVAQTNIKNVLDADTGITGDGVTNDAPAIEALLNTDGRFFFPGVTYRMTEGVRIDDRVFQTVTADSKALFLTVGGDDIDDELFAWHDCGTASEQSLIEWTGGRFNKAGIMNDAGNGVYRTDLGYSNEGASSVHGGMSFWNCYASMIRVQRTTWFNKTDAHLYPVNDSSRQHWMGDPTRGYISGGATYVFANGGPGAIEILNNVFCGSRDSAVYLSGKGNTNTTFPTGPVSRGNRMYFCTAGTVMKSRVVNGTVEDEVHHLGPRGVEFTNQTSGGGIGVANCTARNIRTTGADTAILIKESSHCHVDGLISLDMGAQGPDGDTRTCTGEILISAASAGSSISSITVGAGSNLLASTQTFDGNGSSIEGLARAIAANINSDSVTHGYMAAPQEDTTPGEWKIDISTGLFAQTGDVDGDVIAVTPGGTITTAEIDMAYAFTNPFTYSLAGAQFCELRNSVQSTSLLWALTRSDAARLAFVVSIDQDQTGSGVDAQATSNVFDGARIINGKIGGEGTNGDVDDEADGTIFRNIRLEPTADHTQPTLSGALSRMEWGPGDTRSVATDHTSIATTLDATAEVSELVWNLRGGMTYAIDGILIVSSLDTVDMKFDWTGFDASDLGKWAIQGPNQGITGAGYTGITLTPEATDLNDAVNGIGGSTDEMIGIFTVTGTVVVDDDVTVNLRASQRALDVSNPVTLYVGSRLTFTPILGS
jgi:hypothetical protein